MAKKMVRSHVVQFRQRRRVLPAPHHPCGGPGNAVELRGPGNGATKGKCGERMLETLEKKLAADKDSALLRFSLGNEHLKRGDLAVATAHLRKALGLDPKYSAALPGASGSSAVQPPGCDAGIPGGGVDENIHRGERGVSQTKRSWSVPRQWAPMCASPGFRADNHDVDAVGSSRSPMSWLACGPTLQPLDGRQTAAVGGPAHAGGRPGPGAPSRLPRRM